MVGEWKGEGDGEGRGGGEGIYACMHVFLIVLREKHLFEGMRGRGGGVYNRAAGSKGERE